MWKAWAALSILYATASGCSIAAAAINGGAVDALVMATIACIVPAWGLCVLLVGGTV